MIFDGALKCDSVCDSMMCGAMYNEASKVIRNDV